jgi:Protein of unknown function (DUF1579)
MSDTANHGAGDAGGVSRGTPTGSVPGPEQAALAVLIGKWINEGATVASDELPATPITTSDVYEWAPGGFFVLHTAYGRIGDAGVGGIEIIGYDPAGETYRTHFFDSDGGTRSQEMTLGDGIVTWKGEGARCESTFENDGRTLVAHHERLDENGAWVPSMKVTLRRVD